MRAVLALSALLALLSCREGGEGPRPSPVADCVDRAILFFRRVESYPRLSDGSDARAVAEARCTADPGAF